MAIIFFLVSPRFVCILLDDRSTAGTVWDRENLFWQSHFDGNLGVGKKGIQAWEVTILLANG